MIDGTNVDDVKEGNIVTLIGNDEDNYVSVEKISEVAGTITNEFLSRLSKRLQYYYKEDFMNIEEKIFEYTSCKR